MPELIEGETQLADDYKKLGEREQRFVDLYLVRTRKDEAALGAGYAQNNPANAKQIGWSVFNRPHVKAYIKKALEVKSMTAEEVVNLITDQANSDIRDYFTLQRFVKTTTVEKGLAAVLLDVEYKLAIQREYYHMRFFNREETESIFENIAMYELQIELYGAELKINPLATRFVEVQETVEEKRLDINLLVEDKQRGRVKKVKYGKDGELEVELYSAENAQDRLLRVAGKYEKDNRQKAPVQAPVIINWGDDAEPTSD